MSGVKNRIIYSTDKDFVCFGDTDENKLNCNTCDCAELAYYDEKRNLDKLLDGRVIAIASLGLWNGRKTGYKLLNNNLNSILNITTESFKVFVEKYNNGKTDVKGVYHHHDGTNYVTFRLIDESKNIDKLCEKLYNQEDVTSAMISYYTKSLGEEVKKIYGF
jgi:hypothetical protein